MSQFSAIYTPFSPAEVMSLLDIDPPIYATTTDSEFIEKHVHFDSRCHKDTSCSNFYNIMQFKLMTTFSHHCRFQLAELLADECLGEIAGHFWDHGPQSKAEWLEELGLLAEDFHVSRSCRLEKTIRCPGTKNCLCIARATTLATSLWNIYVERASRLLADVDGFHYWYLPETPDKEGKTPIPTAHLNGPLAGFLVE